MRSLNRNQLQILIFLRFILESNRFKVISFEREKLFLFCYTYTIFKERERERERITIKLIQKFN